MERTKLNCFSTKSDIPIKLIKKEELKNIYRGLPKYKQNWLDANQFTGLKGQVCLVPTAKGDIGEVFVGVDNKNDFYNLAQAYSFLPKGNYYLENDIDFAGLSFGMAAYGKKTSAKLKLTENIKETKDLLDAVYWVRDLINTPANLLGPSELAKEAETLKEIGAKVSITSGAKLDKEFPAIAAVGNGSARKPCLIEINHGSDGHPTLTLVGKGVCFDSGGLNLKAGIGMRNMKKDMGGAAHVLALAKLIILNKLPIRLRVLIPAVENFVSSTSYRPGDIIKTKSGKTIEIDNTDAEGRLILCDALDEASSKKTDLIICMATLTGAASIGLAPDLPSMYCENDQLAKMLLWHSNVTSDKIWHMPFHESYLDNIKNTKEDLLNSTSGHPYGGSIKAALFLREFVKPKARSFVHFDFMAWNVTSKPGRPIGGEAMAIRAIFSYLKEWSKAN